MLFVLQSDFQLLIFTLSVFITLIKLIYRADPRKEKKIKRLCVNFWATEKYFSHPEAQFGNIPFTVHAELSPRSPISSFLQ